MLSSGGQHQHWPTSGPDDMLLKRTARNCFLGTELLGTMRILGDGDSSNFDGNIVSNGSNHSPRMTSVASLIGSVFPHHSVGALHQAVVSRLQTFIGSGASDIGSVFGADLGCARPV